MKRLLLLLVALPALAQVRESMTVEVVEVPVYVTTSAGKPVRGLTRDAFELFVDGKRQPIDFFDAVDFAAVPSPNESPARPLRERRLYLLLFDLSFATPAKLVRAQRAAEQAVAHANSDTDFFAVGTYSAQRGVQFLSSFVRDRAAVLRAIYTLHSGKANDPLGIALSSAERATWVAAGEKDVAVASEQEEFASMLEGEMADAIRGGEANQEALRTPGNRLIEYQIGNLGDTAARLAALEGQKHVIFFTEGFQSARVTDIKSRSGPPRFDARMLDLVKEMHDTFVSAGVMLDTVDIKGLRHSFRDLENDALYMLSRDTGGRVVVNRNDLVEAIDSVTTAQSVVYVLGFHPADRKRGRISVRVKGLPRGSEVSYREGFGLARLKSGIDPLQLADIIVNDVPQTGVTLDSGVTPYDGGAEVAMSFSRAEVVPQLGPDAAVDILIYIFDEHRVPAGFKSKRIGFDSAARIPSGYVTLREPFELPKGKYTAKVLLRISGTNSLGFIRRDFEVTQ
ncbi:MAG: VWA domain-containing protein [Acidobacteriota bacterium]